MSPPEKPSKPQANVFREPVRQLRICNACRYCEGYCPVFASLERRSLLTEGDLTHLAYLCHDCRNCFYACMYSPPHPFAVNLPQIFSGLRRATYDGEPGTLVRRVPSQLRSWQGALLAAVLVAVALICTSLLGGGRHSLVGRHTTPASPYGVVPFKIMLVLVLIPGTWSVLTMARMGRRYWAKIHGSAKSRIGYVTLYRTLAYASDLRYLKGGGAGCAYPDGEMSSARRRLHVVTVYGFVALVLSTMSAGISQDLLGASPPYPILSLPVGLGVAGGVSIILGCTGLIILKARVDPAPSHAQMVIRDYGLMIALDLLSVTGLLTLVLRSTSAFGIVLVAHLAMVVTAFSIAPYTKFVHGMYRFLSILADNVERAANES